MSATSAIVDRIAEVRAMVDAMPAGEEKAKLQIRLQRTATDLAERVRAAAKAKEKRR
jgi:hypothetical protein